MFNVYFIFSGCSNLQQLNLQHFATRGAAGDPEGDPRRRQSRDLSHERTQNKRRRSERRADRLRPGESLSAAECPRAVPLLLLPVSHPTGLGRGYYRRQETPGL